MVRVSKLPRNKSSDQRMGKNEGAREGRREGRREGGREGGRAGLFTSGGRRPAGRPLGPLR